jgi:branched-chain amino acid transport system permease protein
MALGLSIIYGVVGIFNFSHGGMSVLGGYFTIVLLTKAGFSLVWAILVSTAIMFFFGLGLFKITLSTLLRKPNWELACIVFLLGFAILLENLSLQIFGPRVKAFPKFFEGALEIGFVRINWHDISLFLIVIAFVYALNVFLRRTWVGHAMRAVAQEMTGASVVGINVNKTFALAFAIGTAVTAFGGILLATRYYLTPNVGWDWMFRAFIIVVFGGLGSVLGAIYAAFILGLVEALVSLYVNQLWVWPIWFLIFLTVLLIRPQGIHGGRTM